MGRKRGAGTTAAKAAKERGAVSGASSAAAAAAAVAAAAAAARCFVFFARTCPFWELYLTGYFAAWPRRPLYVSSTPVRGYNAGGGVLSPRS